jgi:response regulator RpfG family c-di-GMP phosphodiesterase
LLFARNGAEALAVAGKHLPALILLDIQMPDMDGYAVCRRLKADPRTEAIPVIFISGLAGIGDEEMGFAAGGVDYIVKPISRSILAARVNTHLSLVRASSLNRSYLDAIHMLGHAGHFNDTDTGVHIWRMAAEIALRHHERWDGSGYPDGLQGLDIPVSARVVALADVFDALTMERPYKAAWPMDRVVATIRESAGSHFEPALVQAFDRRTRAP